MTNFILVHFPLPLPYCDFSFPFTVNVLKRILCLLFLISFFSISHEPIPIRSFPPPTHLATKKLFLLKLSKTSLIDSKSNFHFSALIFLDL